MPGEKKMFRKYHMWCYHDQLWHNEALITGSPGTTNWGIINFKGRMETRRKMDISFSTLDCCHKLYLIEKSCHHNSIQAKHILKKSSSRLEDYQLTTIVSNESCGWEGIHGLLKSRFYTSLFVEQNSVSSLFYGTTSIIISSHRL